jgi:hypothetical protein
MHQTFATEKPFFIKGLILVGRARFLILMRANELATQTGSI